MLMEAQIEPQSPSEKKINLQATGWLTHTPSFPESELSFSIPPRQILLWKQWQALQVGLIGSGMGNSVPATQHWTKCLEASSIKWQHICTFSSLIFLSHLLRLPRSALTLHPAQ